MTYFVNWKKFKKFAAINISFVVIANRSLYFHCKSTSQMMPAHFVRKPQMMGQAMPGGAAPQRVMIQRVPYPNTPGTVSVEGVL